MKKILSLLAALAVLPVIGCSVATENASDDEVTNEADEALSKAQLVGAYTFGGEGWLDALSLEKDGSFTGVQIITCITTPCNPVAFSGTWKSTSTRLYLTTNGQKRSFAYTASGDHLRLYQNGQLYAHLVKKVLQHKPVCANVGSRSEGWTWEDGSGFIGWTQCKGVTAVCKAIGTRSEGWYRSDDGRLIKYDNCGKTVPNPCAAMLCAAGTKCIATGTTAACRQTCGGFAGRRCTDTTQLCIDDPTDSCDPNNGGADCSGICIPNRCMTVRCAAGYHCDPVAASGPCVPDIVRDPCANFACPAGQHCTAPADAPYCVAN